MTFISYAQNFEDVMLWRALKHIENGFYVDIGAQDPVVDSISMAFYEHGWRGVHVEPTEQYSTKLRNHRRDEFVYQLALGKGKGSIKFFEILDTGISTAIQSIAESHKKSGYTVKETEVKVITFDDLFYKVGSNCVHWLKIDVEGSEKEVLEGWKKSKVRPWIVVIESTVPLTENANHSEWEEMVLSKNYKFVYFDGLNRFYISNDHPELELSFETPPNVFDRFMLSGRASHPFYRYESSKVDEIYSKYIKVKIENELNRKKVLDLETRVNQEPARVERAEAKAQQAEAKVQQAEAKVQLAKAKVQQAEAKAQLAKAKVQQAEVRAAQAEAKAQQAEVRATEAIAHAAAVEANFRAVVYSRSMRITSPLRWIARKLRYFLKGASAVVRICCINIPSKVIRKILELTHRYSMIRSLAVYAVILTNRLRWVNRLFKPLFGSFQWYMKIINKYHSARQRIISAANNCVDTHGDFVKSESSSEFQCQSDIQSTLQKYVDQWHLGKRIDG